MIKRKFKVISICIVAIILILEISKYILNSETLNNNIFIYLLEYALISLIVIFNIKGRLFTIRNICVFVFSFMIGLSPLFYYLNNGTVISNQLNIIILSYLCFIIGIYISIPWKQKEKNTEKKYMIKLEDLAVIIGCIAILANIYYILTNRQNFFSNNLENNRLNASSSNGLITLICGLINPAIGLLFYKNLENKSKQYRIILGLFIVFAVSSFLIQGSRTPILKLAIMFLLIYNIKKPIKNKAIIIVLILGIVALISMQVLRMNRSNEDGDFTEVLLNTLQNGSINLNYVMNTFPEKVDFQYGYTYLINLIMMRPGPDLDFTLWLKDKVNIQFSGGGLTPTIIGEAYINFGFGGSLVICFLIGILINYLEWKYSVSKKNYFWISYFITIFIDSFRGGLANIEIGLLTYLCLYIFIEKILGTKHKIKGEQYENSDDRA